LGKYNLPALRAPIVFLAMLLNHILIGVFWAVYGVLHSVLASLGVKNYFRKISGAYFKHYRLTYTLFAFIGLILIVWFQATTPSINLFTPVFLTKAAGCIIAVVGLIIMFVCIKKYFMGLSGLRSLLHEEVYSELLISGIHRHVRHPLYLGTFLFIWGLVVVFPTFSLFISSSVITIYTLIGIRLEEKKLVHEFGDKYVAYQESVPKLIPRI
jgi:protein-S-isoprenylcysteine O-methyltransferase Ste14